MFTCKRFPPTLHQYKFSSAHEVEGKLRAAIKHLHTAARLLASRVDKSTDLSGEHELLVTDVFAVLASLPAHAEFAKTAAVQKQAAELCRCLVISINSVGKKFEKRVGGMLADVLVGELYRPSPAFLPLPSLLCIFGELCIASPSTRACAVERSALHRIAALCSQEKERPAVQKQALIALCKLLVYVEHFAFQSCFVDLLVLETIKAPHDVQCTTWVLTVLRKMQESNSRARQYIWTQSPVSRVIVDVLSSNPCMENTSQIMGLLRFPARDPELRMLLARSGVWEVLHAIVSCADVNNMTLQRFAEVFQHFAMCPGTGPVLVGVGAHRTLMHALARVKDSDKATLDKLLLCAYNCCVQNSAFGAKVASQGLLAILHDMCMNAQLLVRSILFAGYALECEGQNVVDILAREVRQLTQVLLSTAPLAGTSMDGEAAQAWACLVSDLRASDLQALPPELVQEFVTAVLESGKTPKACLPSAVHLLARLVCCRSDVDVPGSVVGALVGAFPHPSAALCSALLALARSFYFSKSGAAGKGGGPSPLAKAIADSSGPAESTGVAGSGACAGGNLHDRFKVAAAHDNCTNTSGFLDEADKDTESEHSVDDTQPDMDASVIGLSNHDLGRMLDAFPDNPELLASALCLVPVCALARRDKLCDMFVEAFEGTPRQCLLAMDVIHALLPVYAQCARYIMRHCGLHTLWNALEHRMLHWDEQTSVHFVDMLARACELASKTHEQSVLDKLLDLPFFSALIAHLERAVSANGYALAQSILVLLHTALDVQPATGAVLLFMGATMKLVDVRDVLAVQDGKGELLHAGLGRLVQRLVPPQHAALLARFEQHRAGGTLGKRKFDAHGHGPPSRGVGLCRGPPSTL